MAALMCGVALAHAWLVRPGPATAGGNTSATPLPPPGWMEVALTGVDGREQSLSQFGGRTLIINFFASWCEPCREEMPLLEQLSRSLDHAQYRVVGISLDQDRHLAAEFIRKQRVTFPLLHAPGRTLSGELLGINHLPQTWILTPGHGEAQRIVGLVSLTQFMSAVARSQSGQTGSSGR